MLRIGEGLSTHRDGRRAGRAAARAALKAAGISAADFVVLATTPGYDATAVLGSVRATVGDARLIGCTASCLGTRNLRSECQQAVAVVAWKADELRFEVESVAADGRLGQQAGRQLATRLLPAPADGVLSLCWVNARECDFEGVGEGLGGLGAPLVGGLVPHGDGYALFADDAVVTEGLVLARISGKAAVEQLAEHGCVFVGVERAVTRAEDGQLFELDGIPAVELLRRFLDDGSRDSQCFPLQDIALAVARPGKAPQLSPLLAWDASSGGVRLAMRCHAGDRAWIALRDAERTTRSVARLADRLSQVEAPVFVLQVESAPRAADMLLERDKAALSSLLQAEVPETTPWLCVSTLAEVGHAPWELSGFSTSLSCLRRPRP